MILKIEMIAFIKNNLNLLDKDMDILDSEEAADIAPAMFHPDFMAGDEIYDNSTEISCQTE